MLHVAQQMHLLLACNGCHFLPWTSLQRPVLLLTRNGICQSLMSLPVLSRLFACLQSPEYAVVNATVSCVEGSVEEEQKQGRIQQPL